MTSQEYWNKVANEKTFSTPFQLDIYKKYVKKDDRILDIGCGYGRTLEELQNAGYNNLIGIDFSKEMIKLAKTKNPSIDFRPTNGSILDFPDDSIDSVILLAVLTCIPDKDNQKQLIGEVHRVLKKEGIIYINDYLLNDTDMYLERYKKYQDKYEYGVFETSDGGVFRHHSEEYLEELLSSFKTEEVKTLKYTTMNGHTSNGIYYIGRK